MVNKFEYKPEKHKYFIDNLLWFAVKIIFIATIFLGTLFPINFPVPNQIQWVLIGLLGWAFCDVRIIDIRTRNS